MKKLFARLFQQSLFQKPLVQKPFFQGPRDQEFVSLMQIALEDQTIRHQLLKILSLPDDRRKATVRQWRTELEQQRAPEPIMRTLAYLEDDGLARRALEILKEYDE